MENAILIRFGEVFLKKGNRPWFLRLLNRNLKEALTRGGCAEGLKVKALHGRYEVVPTEGEFPPELLAQACDILTRTFGVVSVSPAVTVPTDYEQLEKTGLELVARELTRREVCSFKVNTSRPFKRFPMKSPDVNRRIGAHIISHHPMPVKMSNPDLELGIEITADRSFLFVQTRRGPGGLPVGCSGKAVLLLSGGIDSPVAGWMMAKRGCRVIAAHCHSYPYTSRKSLKKVELLAESLARWVGPVRLISMEITAAQEYFRDRVPNDKLVLFYRRTMVRLAERVARETNAAALITGESLAQVASQTIENLAVVQDAASLPMLRPLVGMDKMETVDLARRIGTFDISVQPYDDCCSLFLPPHPETRGRVREICSLEEGLDQLHDLEDRAFEGRQEKWF